MMDMKDSDELEGENGTLNFVNGVKQVSVNL